MLVGARYYDAQVGRFISRDTYLDQHPYLYCDHDPVNAVDPSGHFIQGWDRLVGGIGTIGVGGGLVSVGFIPAMPAIGAGAFVVAGVGAMIVGGWIVGDWIADRIYSGPPPELPPINRDEFERYKEEIIKGRLRGDIPMPPGGRWLWSRRPVI
jgi:hypothetical protein